MEFASAFLFNFNLLKYNRIGCYGLNGAPHPSQSYFNPQCDCIWRQCFYFFFLWLNRNLYKFIFVRILILQRASVVSIWFKPCLSRIHTNWLFTAFLTEEQKILCCFTIPANFILMQNLTACHLMNEVISKCPALPFLYMSSDTVFFSIHAPFLAFGLHGDCELLARAASLRVLTPVCILFLCYKLDELSVTSIKLEFIADVHPFHLSSIISSF